MNKNIITISIIAFIAFSGGFLAATAINYSKEPGSAAVSYTHLRAHETVLDLVCRLLLEKKQTPIHTHPLHF